MAEVEIKYTIPSGASGADDPGFQGDVILTYDPSQVGSDGSVIPTAASGTISEIDQNGKVVVQDGVAQTDTVTGIADPKTTITANAPIDNKLFLNPTATEHYLDQGGLGLTVSGPFSDLGGNVTNNTGVDAIFYGTVQDAVLGNLVGYHEENGAGSDANATSFTVTPVCFASGTSIRTVRDEVAVEELRIGDLIVTASGEARPVRWLGHRTIDCRSHKARQSVLPVRIAAHAFGEERPSRDLLVSPGHAVQLNVLGDVLIPAAALVNGTTVAQVEVETVTYWHVELESHDVLLAENLACESYLEMGNRSFFAESGIVTFGAQPDAERTHADFCRPFHASGLVVEAARHLLAARAGELTRSQGSKTSRRTELAA